MSQPVYGTIVNHRIGIRTQMPKWCLIHIMGENTASKAGQLVGRKMILKFGKNSFIGKIMGLHGKKGVVTAKSQKGILGQALGARVELLGQRAQCATRPFQPCEVLVVGPARYFLRTMSERSSAKMVIVPNIQRRGS
jgi:ribosomal protein L35AE/L33A